YPASSYLNMGTTAGSDGYGIRDNAGDMEYKDSGGNWIAFGNFLHQGSNTLTTGFSLSGDYGVTFDVGATSAFKVVSGINAEFDVANLFISKTGGVITA